MAYASTYHAYPARRRSVDELRAALAKDNDDSPVILLAHQPDFAVQAPNRVSLLRSQRPYPRGQVRLFGWSPVVPPQYRNRDAYAHIRQSCEIVSASRASGARLLRSLSVCRLKSLS